MTMVPRTTQVVAGAFVNIVLKADQRTGRQVSGKVKDVLTKGDHHRGIKVRLTDGRIGRVQSMGTAGSAPTTQDSASAVADKAEDQAIFTGEYLGEQRQPQQQFGGGRRGKYRDIREDEALEAPPQEMDLSAYIKPAKPRGKGKKGKAAGSGDGHNAAATSAGETAPTDVTSANVTCPVCNAFEGDEAAVAHHVAGHFE